MIRSRFLRKNAITRPEDLLLIVNNPKTLSLLIKKIRMSKDVILHNDNNLYKSLHDDLAKEIVRKGTNMSLKDFNQIYSTKFNIFLKKVKKEDFKKLLYNPYKQNLGLLQYAQNMERDEFIDFQSQLLESMRSDIFEKVDLDKMDIDQTYYNAITSMIDNLKVIQTKKEKFPKLGKLL